MAKICFFSGDISRNGGTERVATMIANALSDASDHKILFLSLVEQNRKIFFPLNDTIPHFALGNVWIDPGPGYLKIIPKLRKFIKEKKIDILIDIDIVLDVLSVPASRKLPVKIISWEHFNYFYERSVLYRRWILHLFTKKTDAVVTLTKRDALAFQKALHRKERIYAIYNPMVISVDVFSDSQAESKMIMRENALITVGRLAQIKGIDHLIEVAKRLLPAHPDWKWYVIGEGEERIGLEKAIRSYHLEDQLILTGQLSDVTPYLKKSKIYVMTSHIEGLPMCLLEAKTYKLPMVSFDIRTGPNEIIEHEKSGYLIPPFDHDDMIIKLEKLMTDPSLWRRFSDHAWDNIEKFQMEKIIKNWKKLFHRLI